MDILDLIDENSSENNLSHREIKTFAPRLWRVNEDLARKIFEYECKNSKFGGDICSRSKHHPFCKENMLIPYSATTFIRWYTTKDKEEMDKWYWKYIEHCEHQRGQFATNCRSKDSMDYIPPYSLDHFENFKLNPNQLGR